jgi:hypothetical protein
MGRDARMMDDRHVPELNDADAMDVVERPLAS